MSPKSQFIRVLDVLAVGPLMIWGGLTARARAPRDPRGVTLGLLLAFLGLSTMVYNAINWLELENLQP